jgi:hypothetical protein
MLQRFNISAEELEQAAAENTARSDFEIFNIMEIMNRMQGVDYEPDGAEPPMYVLTNRTKSYGATVMLCGSLFAELADKYNSDLYILPSSVHEVIAIPANLGMAPEELKGMVEAVNNEQVAEPELLSGTVYRWNRENKEMSIAV